MPLETLEDEASQPEIRAFSKAEKQLRRCGKVLSLEPYGFGKTYLGFLQKLDLLDYVLLPPPPSSPKVRSVVRMSSILKHVLSDR